MKATQRLAHGLSGAVAYTFSKELTNGANSDTSYLTPNPPLINDVFNRASAKQLSSLGGPFNVNPTTLKTTNNTYLTQTGLLSGGYGFVNWVNGAGARPRSGQIVARLIF